MLLKEIRKEVQDFENKDIQVVPGLSFNQHDLIEQIFFYYHSKFTTGDLDSDGDRKYFYNIVKNPCKVFTKAIDFDTKNIRLLTTESGDPLKTWFMERDLKYWMRDQQFGKVLNRIFKELPIFGSVVLKIVKGEPMFVDLRNFVVEQSADTLDDSNFIIEAHNFTVPEFRRVGKQMGWDKSKVEDAIDKFRGMKNASHIRVYERYGEVEEDGEYTYKRVFIADVGVDEYDNYGNLVHEAEGVELASDKWDEHPYWEFHTDKLSGRWLGIGVVETLIEPQVRQNELVNLQSKASYWAALRVFQTRDAAASRNLLTDTRNGDVLNVDSEITQIDMSDRNLAFFNQQRADWMANRDELTFAYDAIQGERSPAGTPLGSTELSVGQALSYFSGIQEDIAMDVKEMLYKVVLPEFEKKATQKHTLRIIGEDLDTFIGMVKNQLILEEVVKTIAKTGTIPSSKDKDVIEMGITAAIKQKKEHILKIPKGFYDGIKYDIDIDITGESVDTRVKNATMFAILQAITTDPAMLTDPTKRKFLYKLCEQGGINPNDLFEVDEKTMIEAEPEVAKLANKSAATGGVGGGVSAPAMTMGAIPGQAQQTI